jgi:hypothetical protein
MAERRYMRSIWGLATANAAARSQALDFAEGPRTKPAIPTPSAIADSVANAGIIHHILTAKHKDPS